MMCKYDPIRAEYTITISKQELEEAFKSREAYRDFLYRNFGLTLDDYEKMEAKE